MLVAVKLDTIADLYKYGYSGYGIGFDARSQFSRADGSWGKIVVSFGVDNSSFVHVDNKKKDILVLGEGLPQRLDDTMIQQKFYLFYKTWNKISSAL